MDIQNKSIRFMCVGDLMFYGEITDNILRNKDVYFPFSKIRDILAEADVLYGNLETVITKQKKAEEFVPDPIYFTELTETAKVLKETGFTVISTANNHIYDFGLEGVETTIKSLDENTLKYS